DGGWGWNGTSQTHEMMTPYALCGLIEAEKAGHLIPNPEAMERGLNRLQAFLKAISPMQTADYVYCLYVFGQKRPVTKEHWEFVANGLEQNKLSDYALALALELALKNDRKDLAAGLAGRLRQRAKREGAFVYWTTAGFSRWGEDRNEITAVAFKALLAYD